MKVSSAIPVTLVAVALAAREGASFQVVVTPSYRTKRIPGGCAEQLFGAAAPANDSNSAEPFFQMQQIPTAITTSRLDHVVDCAENGQCDVEEMAAMIDELERLNDECQGALSRECNLDAVAARNVLKVALASKVATEMLLHECTSNGNNDDGISSNKSAINHYDEVGSMSELDDECVRGVGEMMHGLPADALNSITTSSMDRFVECSTETGECSLNEIAGMISELERLNEECLETTSRECNLDAMEARNILKVALGAQAILAREEAVIVMQQQQQQQKRGDRK